MKMIKMVMLLVTMISVGSTLAGCGFALIGPSRTTVELVNNGAFQVDVDLFYSDTQEILEILIKELGDELNISLAPGATETFSRNCDDLQAIIVDDADLRIIGGAGVDTMSDILRDGDDFRCGDTITFTFTHGVIPTDFNVRTSVR